MRARLGCCSLFRARTFGRLRTFAAVPLRQLLEHLAVLAIATVFHEVTVAICSEAYRSLSECFARDGRCGSGEAGKRYGSGSLSYLFLL